MSNITTNNQLIIDFFSTLGNYNFSSFDNLNLNMNSSIQNFYTTSNIGQYTLNVNETNGFFYSDRFLNVFGDSVSFWNSSSFFYGPSTDNFISGCQITDTTTNTITLSSGQCIISNAINLNASLWIGGGGTIDLSINGENGLDTGSVTQDTWYYLYAIGSIGLNKCNLIGSTTPPYSGPSKLGPVLPVDYVSWRYLGSVKTKTSTTDIIKVKQTGTGSIRRYQWLELDGQNCINDTGGTPSSFSLNQGASLISIEAELDMNYLSLASSNTVFMATNSTDTIGITITNPTLENLYKYCKIAPDINNSIWISNPVSGAVLQGLVLAYTESI